jgi:hypothetical protein
MKKILILGLIIRLICLYLFRNVTNYDLDSYLQVGELTLKGINIYPDVANLHHPYLPFFLYLEAMAYWLGRSKIIIITIIKIINVIFDLGILNLVYLLSKKSLKTAFLYAINPVTILITTLHGQFDVIPVFFILLVIYLLNKKQELLSVLSFSFAVLTKTWPILFFIPIARRVKKKRLLILIFLFPILFSFYYSFRFKTSLINIISTVLNYQGLWGIWGVWGLLGKTRIFWQKLTTLIFLTCFFGYSYFKNKKKLIEEVLNLLFFFFIFTTNFSIQYFVWIIPFLILIKPKNYLFLIILISFYLFSFYYFWLFCSSCKIMPQWLVITQNIIGFILWLSFIKVGYLSRKIS